LCIARSLVPRKRHRSGAGNRLRPRLRLLLASGLFVPTARARQETQAIDLLEDWQRERFAAAPWPFIRGCIRTDGCAFINRTQVHRPEPYEYLSYEFSNKSKNIVDLFVEACDRVGVFTRVTYNATGRWSVRINRRASVALMLEHVGVKA
jgi:hypothetical protein